MNRRPLVAATAVAVSVAAHAALIAISVITIRPDPVEQQTPPPARLDIAAYSVEQTPLDARKPDADQARRADAEPSIASTPDIRRTEGASVRAEGASLAAQQLAGGTAEVQQARGKTVASVSAEASSTAPNPVSAATVLEPVAGAAPETVVARAPVAAAASEAKLSPEAIAEASGIFPRPLTAVAVAEAHSKPVPSALNDQMIRPSAMEPTGSRAQAVQSTGTRVQAGAAKTNDRLLVVQNPSPKKVTVSSASGEFSNPILQISPDASVVSGAQFPATSDATSVVGASTAVSDVVEVASKPVLSTSAKATSDVAAVMSPESVTQKVSAGATLGARVLSSSTAGTDLIVAVAQAASIEVTQSAPTRFLGQPIAAKAVVQTNLASVARAEVEYTARPQTQAPVAAPQLEQAPTSALTLATPDEEVSLLDTGLQAEIAAPGEASGTAAKTLVPDSHKTTAALAWSGSEENMVDPVSLAAIQSFMLPQDTASLSGQRDDLRDGIADILAQVPCSRTQTRFNPENGVLELHGHVPDSGLRAPVLAALQSQIGSSIPVVDRMLILPRPQCNILPAVTDIGLPQSTEQETNPKVVGLDSFVREYRYSAGQRLELAAQTPDYEAVIYVDYFDANGDVIHLQPNEIVPLETYAPKDQVTIGQLSPSRPSLEITISPPYGQEIAVAMATSQPLYDGLRPFVEPAGPYLEFLSERVAAIRETDATFKGEWVYFFITTSAN